MNKMVGYKGNIDQLVYDSGNVRVPGEKSEDEQLRTPSSSQLKEIIKTNRENSSELNNNFLKDLKEDQL